MGVVRCPKCGNKTTTRTAKKDDSVYYVCINYPKCRGRVLADEDEGGGWGGDSGQESPTPEPAYDRPLPRVRPASPERGAGKTVRAAKKGGRKVRAGAKHPERKGRVSLDNNWGDDWNEETPAPKPAPVQPRQKIQPKRGVAPEKKEPPKPGQQIAPKRYLAPAPQQQIAPKADAILEVKTPPKLRQRRVPQSHLSPVRKKRSIKVIIIALVIAFLAIDGMIYAAFVLR
jgi:ssDNA-binding Zn-finger/Zn-ribbon topoisomerase 1